MKTKEQVIKEAYGDQWQDVKDLVNENGWVKFREIRTLKLNNLLNDKLEIVQKALKFNESIESNVTKGYFWIRTKTLSGIENNNGWIKIENIADLPKDAEALYDLTNINKNSYLHGKALETLTSFWESNTITHYKHSISSFK